MSDRWCIVPANQRERRELIAAWWVIRFREMAAEEGTQVAARRLRKAGVPLWIALRVLGIAPTRY
jgi:hypothetical protein